MVRRYGIFLLCAAAWLAQSCSYTRFVPEGKYLLNKARVKVTDTKELEGDDLTGYLRQQPNTEILGFWKLELNIWNWQGRDSTKWINRQLRKIGEAPEVFSEGRTEQSMAQLKQAMDNRGYFESTVDTVIQHKKRKVNLTYQIKAGEPYRIRSYKADLPLPDLQRFATRRSLIHEGMLFNSDLLNEERERLTTLMRNSGYYYFDTDFLQYIADSTHNAHAADVRLQIQERLLDRPDSVRAQAFGTYTIRRVEFHLNNYTALNDSAEYTTSVRGNYVFHTQGRSFLRERVLIRQCHIRPGDLYNQSRVERTFSSLNALGPVRYADIRFVPAGNGELDCHITLMRAKEHGVTAELDGTYSAGDWGVAGGLGYVNRNLFRGSEQLSLSAHVSYEWRENGSNALETKAQAKLTFPSRVGVTVGYSYQLRPEEFTRTIANAGLNYYFITHNNRWRHSFDLIDINYVYLPSVSDRFREEFMKPTDILRYSYEDHFIMDWSYSGHYSSYRSTQPLRSHSTINYTLETAGNLLYGISHVVHQQKNSNGQYEVFKVPYAQYVKGDINWTYNHILNKQQRLVYHAGLGIAVPFGNSSAVPFEKRYFSGGSNSVRGWTMRSLGPGGYRGTGTRIDFNNQSGDIKLDLNLEYRVRVVWALEFAAFTDAGNIWTIRDYDTQPNGVFKFNEFYKQIAWSYGVGIRLNFDFLVLRVDFGVKLYDPARIDYDGRQWRTVANGLGWSDDMTFHFAIGYPF